MENVETDMHQEAANLPDWGKVQFREYPRQSWSELLPRLSDVERDLVGSLVIYESSARATASKVRQAHSLETAFD